jgi:hypothetical protein
MIINEVTDHDKENYGQYASVSILLNGKRFLSIGPGEPEDATIYRDLSDVYKIKELIKFAYEAGKLGSSLEIITSETQE